MFLIKPSVLIGMIMLVLTLTSCSSIGSSRSEVRDLPNIPEIKRQVVVRPKTTAPQKTVKRTAVVKPYNPGSNSQATITEAEQYAAKELLKTEAKQKASVEIDPYASIPENNPVTEKQVTTITGTESSPAVKSLMIQARADIELGKSRSAMSSLERGLRIEPQNPKLWNMLAKAHFEQSEYQQSISMAKKSIRYSNDDNFIAQNWQLIKKAGEKSGDMTAVKEAIDYIKIAP